MYATLDEHRKRIYGIRNYIKMTKEIAMIPSQYPEEGAANKLKGFICMPQKRSYDYSLIIVTLYGVFESYVEKIVCAYLLALNKQIKMYNQLPGAICRSHTALSTKLLSVNSSKFGQIKEGEVIANLNSCLNQTDDDYKLNIDAFRQHSSNFRTDSLREFFKMIGIGNVENRIAQDPSLNAFIQATMGEEGEGGTYPTTKYFEKIEDLVERRNVVAHGSEADDLLSLDILDEYAQYVKLMIDAIYNVLFDEYCSLLVEKSIAKKLGKAIKVYNNQVICINSANNLIKINDIIIGKSVVGKIHWGHIQSLQIDGNDVQEVPVEESKDIGIAVSFHAKDNYEYYLLSNNF